MEVLKKEEKKKCIHLLSRLVKPFHIFRRLANHLFWGVSTHFSLLGGYFAHFIGY